MPCTRRRRHAAARIAQNGFPPTGTQPSLEAKHQRPRANCKSKPAALRRPVGRQNEITHTMAAEIKPLDFTSPTPPAGRPPRMPSPPRIGPVPPASPCPPCPTDHFSQWNFLYCLAHWFRSIPPSLLFHRSIQKPQPINVFLCSSLRCSSLIADNRDSGKWKTGIDQHTLFLNKDILGMQFSYCDRKIGRHRA